MSGNLSVISLFTGAGGLDIGLEFADFSTRVAVEMDSVACSTLRFNRPNVPVIEGPLEAISSRKILRTAQLRKREADLLIGGPPCQPFSKAGYWSNGSAGRLLDPRARTLREFMRVLEDTLPRVFLIENVPGFVFKGKDEGLKFLTRRLRQINGKSETNYSLSWQVINTADYGVPQLRERVVLVGSRNGHPFSFPEKRFGIENQVQHEYKRTMPFRTAWDAIADLPPSGPLEEDLMPSGKWAELLPSIPEGENYLFHTSRKKGLSLFGWRTRYWSFLLKLSKRLPSWTIQAQPGSAIGPFHWNNRKLSVRELMRIQTFPDSYHIQGGRTDAQRQIGNAVPSLLGEIIGRSIREQFFNKAKMRCKLKLLPPLQGPPPRARATRPVPEKYLKLVGKYPDHPGKGRGPGAKRLTKSSS